MSVTDFYDEHSVEYDATFTRNVDLAENRFLFGRLGAHVPGRTLDLGCGTGLVHDYTTFDAYLGIDLSRGMLKLAERRCPACVFRVMDMRKAYDLGSSRYDTVISTFGAMSYVTQDVYRVFEGIKHVLRPGGRIFLCVYGPRYPKRAHYIAKGELPVWTYTPRQLASLMPWAKGKAYSFNVMLDAVPDLPERLLVRLMALGAFCLPARLPWGLWTVFEGTYG